MIYIFLLYLQDEHEIKDVRVRVKRLSGKTLEKYGAKKKTLEKYVKKRQLWTTEFRKRIGIVYKSEIDQKSVNMKTVIKRLGENPDFKQDIIDFCGATPKKWKKSLYDTIRSFYRKTPLVKNQTPPNLRRKQPKKTAYI